MVDGSSVGEARASAFRDWVRSAKAAGEAEPQRPELELLAEHHLMCAAVSAMEREALELRGGASLRPDFWQLAVDFVGNFTHRVHRAKEEQIFFPALRDWGLLSPEHCDHFEHDHGELGELTGELCEGVGDGDWEKTLRMVSMYLDRIRSHLDAEERTLLAPELAKVPTERLAPIRESFREIEEKALGPGGRRSVLDLVEALSREAGLAGPSG